MTTYRVTATFSEKELLNYINVNGSTDVKIEAVREESSDAPVRTPRAIKKTVARRKRGSKVIDTILDRLGKGEAAAADLRSSLEEAGLSPGSLSTGLALLQKDGKVRRGDGGSYALAEAA